MARYSNRISSYVFLNVLSYFFSLTLEQALTRFAGGWMVFFGFLGLCVGTMAYIVPCIFLALWILWLNIDLPERSFGEFFYTKEKLDAPKGLGRSALGISYNDPVVDAKFRTKAPGKFVMTERATNRQVFLRGINVSGSTKLPFGVDSTQKQLTAPVTFVGRPFPLEEADTHFQRLVAYGFTFFRLLITWEAVEHEAPGEYDWDYIRYLQKLVEKAGTYGITVFIDPHQDVWSRCTGGDGAPLWTLDMIGLDAERFKDTLAAYCHEHEPEKYCEMIWPTNYNHLACGTMFTLFFGGNDFAPRFRVNRAYSRIYNDAGTIDESVLDMPTGPGRSPQNGRSLRFSKSGSFSPSKLISTSNSPKKARGDTDKVSPSPSITGKPVVASNNPNTALDQDSIEIKITDQGTKIPETNQSLHNSAIHPDDVPYVLLDSADSPSHLFTEQKFCSVQDFLQDHFVLSMRAVARALKKYDNVIGFDTMNEPDYGFLGREDLSQYRCLGGDDGLPVGWLLSPYESMLLGSGASCAADFFEGGYRLGKCVEMANPRKRSCWKPGYECIWKQHGIYDISATGAGHLFDKNYFAVNPTTKKKVDPHHDYLVPFWEKMNTAIKTEMGPDAIVFCSPFAYPMDLKGHGAVKGQERGNPKLERAIYAAHYYEGLQLLNNRYRPNFVANWRALTRKDEKHQLALTDNAANKDGTDADDRDPHQSPLSSESPYGAGAVTGAAVTGEVMKSPNALNLSGFEGEGIHDPSSITEKSPTAADGKKNKNKKKGGNKGGKSFCRKLQFWKDIPIVLGPEGMVTRSQGEDIKHHASDGDGNLGPCVVGEIGISMHIPKESERTRCMERQMRALEYSGVSGYCLWNYTPQSIPGSHKGDGWNREFLSIFSQCDTMPNASLYDGGRTLPATIRPSPVLVAGRITKFSFEGLTAKRKFTLEYEEIDTCLSNETVIFLPYYQYSEDGLQIEVSDGNIQVKDLHAQRLVWLHGGVSPDKDGKRLHKIVIWQQA